VGIAVDNRAPRGACQVTGNRGVGMDFREFPQGKTYRPASVFIPRAGRARLAGTPFTCFDTHDHRDAAIPTVAWVRRYCGCGLSAWKRISVTCVAPRPAAIRELGSLVRSRQHGAPHHKRQWRSNWAGIPFVGQHFENRCPSTVRVRKGCKRSERCTSMSSVTKRETSSAFKPDESSRVLSAARWSGPDVFPW
jgi:hypothetical protein